MNQPPPDTISGDCRWIETLRDRSQVLVRPLGKQDRDAGNRFLAEASPRHFRFFGEVAGPDARTQGRRFAGVDSGKAQTFVAIVQEAPYERIVGMSRYAADGRGLRCECSVSVNESWHGKGLGASLMRHLIRMARVRGIRSMHSVDTAADTAMTDLALRLGFRTTVDPDAPGLVVHELEL